MTLNSGCNWVVMVWCIFFSNLLIQLMKIVIQFGQHGLQSGHFCCYSAFRQLTPFSISDGISFLNASLNSWLAESMKCFFARSFLPV